MLRCLARPILRGVAVLVGMAGALACSLVYPVANLEGAAGPDASETGAPADGAVDGACDAGFCACLAPSPTLCDDFDRGALDPRWTLRPDTPPQGASIAIDQDASASSPSSLSVVFPPMSGGGENYVETTFDGPFREARLELDILIPEGFPGGQVATFRFASGYTIGLGFTRSVVTTYEEPSQTTRIFDGAPLPKAGAWTHVTFILRPSDPSSGAPGLVRVGFGSADAGLRFYDQTVDTGAPGATTTLMLGGVYVDAPQGWRANFDDVVLRLSP